MVLGLCLDPANCFADPPIAGNQFSQNMGVAGSCFRTPEIQASAVIVEIFSMYCPCCQQEAPNINRLYEAIESEDTLRNRIKVMGIGAGNSDFEVDFSRKSYGIPFPLFSDGDGAMLHQLGRIHTPFFIVIRIERNSATIVFTHSGAFEKMADFLQTVIRRAGIPAPVLPAGSSP